MVDYYFKLDPNIRNRTEVLFGKMEIEGLANQRVDSIRHFYDIMEPPITYFDNEKIHIQDFLLNLRTAYGETQGYRFSGRLFDLTQFVEKLAYTREIYACVKSKDEPMKIKQVIFPSGIEGKNLQSWTATKGKARYCLFRIITNMFFLEQLNNVVLCSAGKTRERQIERMNENLDRLVHHIMENIRSYVPKFPRDSNWKEFEDFVDEPNEITLYLTQFYGPPYKAKFHPRMIRALLNFAGVEKNGVTGDFMLGSGTLAIESVLLNVRTKGSDINPLAEIVTRAKIDALNFEPEELQGSIDKVLFDLKGAQTERMQESAGLEASLFEEKEDLRDKALLFNRHIRKEVKEDYRNFFLCALARAVSSAFKMKNDPDLLGLLESDLWQMWKMVYCLNSARRFLHVPTGKADISVDDVRILSSITDGSVNLIVTSPPYSTAIDYVKMDLPQLLLLELIRTSKELDENMIGTHRKTSNSSNLAGHLTESIPLIADESNRFRKLPKDAQTYILDLKKENDPKKALACYRFLYDIWDALSQMYRVLTPGGKCIIIIGNNVFKVGAQEREFRNGDFLEEMATSKEIGFLKWHEKMVREYSKSSYGTILKEDIIFLRKRD